MIMRSYRRDRGDRHSYRRGRMVSMAGTLVLLRHGFSEWNAKNLFTGWVDVDLTAQGESEARRGGVLPLRIPILVACSSCHGAGHVFGFACRRCDATGPDASRRCAAQFSFGGP